MFSPKVSYQLEMEYNKNKEEMHVWGQKDIR